MSQPLSPVVIQRPASAGASSVVVVATPGISRSVVPRASPVVPLSATPMASARLTGLVAPNTPVVPVSTPVSIPQTVSSVSSPIPLVPVATITTRPPSPARTVVITRPPSPARTVVAIPPSPTRAASQVQAIIPTVPPSPVRATVPVVPPSPSRITVPVIPPSPTRGTVPAPTARNVLTTLGTQVRVPTPSTGLPVRPTAEIMQQEFEVRDYQGIIQNASIENELLNAGYAPLSKIVVRTDAGQRRTQYIKAVNKKGQKVFILVDVPGYTTARSTDLTLIEAQTVNIVPYSLKTGAYECAGRDVCGVAFECGSDAVCVLTRGNQDLTPKEANFVYVEQQGPAAATLESEGSIMTYPVIRLSEIRANPALVLQNTDTATRRLRNAAYQAAIQDLASSQQSIGRLNEAFLRFDTVRNNAAVKLARTLQQLEQWNEVYISNPPATDELKDRYRRLQANLVRRNDGISTLLRIMRRVADKRAEVDVITREINELTDLAEKEFANVEYAVAD